ncbi:hypothetical protein Dimus_020540 [Dionaea muscipula]
MHSLCEHGRVYDAFELLTRLENEGISPDTITFNILISGLRKQGKLEEAIELLDRMMLKGLYLENLMEEVDLVLQHMVRQCGGRLRSQRQQQQKSLKQDRNYIKPADHSSFFIPREQRSGNQLLGAEKLLSHQFRIISRQEVGNP